MPRDGEGKLKCYSIKIASQGSVWEKCPKFQTQQRIPVRQELKCKI